MINGIITYLIIGVVFNFIFDKLVDFNKTEEFRFSNLERLVMTLIWPIGLVTFLFHSIKNFGK